MKKKNHYPLVICFALFIFGFTVADFITKPSAFSEMENRPLEQRPKFTIEGFLNASYPQNYETFLNDQFVLRDQFIDLKSRAEYAMLRQENNNVVYGKDGYMFERFESYNEAAGKSKLRAIVQMAEQSGASTQLMLVPNSYEILSEKLPVGLSFVDQKKAIEAAYGELAGTAVKPLDVYAALSAHKDEDLYYKTDHHWTAQGAYLAYVKYCEENGLEPVPYASMPQKEVSGFYGTYFSKSKAFWAEADTITAIDVDATIETEGKTYHGLYDWAQFEKRDKYGAILYGNHPVMKITSGVNKDHREGETSRLLVVKDSYANSFIPYLLYHYDEVYVVDLRYYSLKLSDYMKENSIQNVLVLYNFTNFATDTNFGKLVR